MTGGYDEGYIACSCFWGKSPGSLLSELARQIESFDGYKALDLGCGEGKNAAFLEANGCCVRAIDISPYAISNAKKAWPSLQGISWEISDVIQIALPPQDYDIVVCYGMLHCLRAVNDAKQCVLRLQDATRHGGYNVICTFNSRHQELDAHPGFNPLLMPHNWYLDLYQDWEILISTDSDLTEQHPHNEISHTHSMTRILAKKR